MINRFIKMFIFSVIVLTSTISQQNIRCKASENAYSPIPPINEEWPRLSRLRRDYNKVPVVAHVRVFEARIFHTDDAYDSWYLTGEVIEPFKGIMSKGQIINFVEVADKGLCKKERFLGDMIVFLWNKLFFMTLENSTLSASRDRINELRNIRQRIKPNAN